MLDRAYSTSAVDDIKKSSSDKAEAEALASVDEAIAKEIAHINNSNPSRTAELRGTVAAAEDVILGEESSAFTKTPLLPLVNAGNEANPLLHNAITSTAQEPSAIGADSAAFTKQIVTLQDAHRFAEIPSIFEHMLAEGVRPTTEAYTGLLAAVINIPMDKHQRVSKALGIYTNMLEHKVSPDVDFYHALILLLADRALHVSKALKSMNQQRKRVEGFTENGRSLLESKDTEYKILAEDDALTTTIRMFNLSVRSAYDRYFSSELYRLLITACADHGDTEEMLRIYNRMEAHKIIPAATMFPPMIEALGACGDLASVVVLYDGYRALAISTDRGVLAMNGREDAEVYAAVIKAYVQWGRSAGGEKFLGKILESYGTHGEKSQEKVEAMQDAVILKAFIATHLDSGKFGDAFNVVQEKALSDEARDEAYAKISATAADKNLTEVATTAYRNIDEHHPGKTEAAIAMLALHARKGEIEPARGYWCFIVTSPRLSASFLELAAMYATVLIRNGFVDEALVQSREAFARIRASALRRSDIVEEIDEAMLVIGAAVRKFVAQPSGPAVVSFLWGMMENRGLVVPVAEQMMAGLGLQDVLELSVQDVTLALQAQADMIAHRDPLLDIQHPQRFAHLLDLMIARRIAPEQSTFELVARAAERLSPQRPELLAQWQSYQQSFITPPYTPVPYTPQPMTPIARNTGFADSFDPYAATTDVRGSNIMADVLDFHRAGTLVALDEAMSRLQNMRHVDRHPRYIVYAKLIAAAAKEKRINIIRDVHTMAKSDIPYLAQYPPFITAGP